MYLVTRNWHVWELCVSCVHILKNLCTRVMYFEKSKVKLAFFTHIFYFSHMFLLSFGLFLLKLIKLVWKRFKFVSIGHRVCVKPKKLTNMRKIAEKSNEKYSKKFLFENCVHIVLLQKVNICTCVYITFLHVCNMCYVFENGQKTTCVCYVCNMCYVWY